jgi:ABC-type transporter Mla subunit MlaD
VKDEVTDVINNLIDTVNQLNDKVKDIEDDMVGKLHELGDSMEKSQKDVAQLLGGVVDLLTSVTQKEFRVNDLILEITDLVADHTKKREDAGEIIE